MLERLTVVVGAQLVVNEARRVLLERVPRRFHVLVLAAVNPGVRQQAGEDDVTAQGEVEPVEDLGRFAGGVAVEVPMLVDRGCDRVAELLHLLAPLA